MSSSSKPSPGKGNMLRVSSSLWIRPPDSGSENEADEEPVEPAAKKQAVARTNSGTYESGPKPWRDWLAALVSQNTVSSRPNLRLLDQVQPFLESNGAECQRFPSPDGMKANLLAVFGPKNTPGGLVLSGHTDVVPVSGQEWNSDPFTLYENNGLVYGRGTCDMKGYLACVLAAVPELALRKFKKPLYLAFSYDEEVGCTGVISMVQHMSKLEAMPAAVLVGEPTSMELGVSAIAYASKLIQFLSELAEELKTRGDVSGRFQPPYTTISLGSISGGTAINIIARDCVLEWECRCLPEQDPNEILGRFRAESARLAAEMQAVDERCSIVTEMGSAAPGLLADPKSRAFELASLALGDDSGPPRAVSYGTEAAHFQRIGIPSVIVGPGSITQAHAANEFCPVDQLDQCFEFVKTVVKEHCQE